MTEDTDLLLLRMIGGDRAAGSEVVDRAATSVSPRVLVAAAVLTGEHAELARATGCAVTTRDRQLVAVAAAHLDGDEDLLDALVRDHLSDYPDNLLAAWIAAKHTRPDHANL